MGYIKSHHKISCQVDALPPPSHVSVMLWLIRFISAFEWRNEIGFPWWVWSAESNI